MKEGWEYKKLGEVCTFTQGMQVPIEEQSLLKEDGFVRFLRIIDFTQGKEEPRYVRCTNDKYILHNNEIAIVRYGTPGFVCYGKIGAIANNLFKITPNQDYKFNSKFLVYWLNSNAFQLAVRNNQYGVALQAIKFSTIHGISIPIPPLSEQQRIVSELDLLSSIIEKKKTQLKEYDQLAQSIFYDMFGDPITNEKGWEVRKLGEVGELQRGSGLSKKDLIENGYPCILYGQIHTKYGAFTKKHIACIPQELVKTAKIAHFGDLIMAITSEDVEGSCKSVAWMGDYDIAVGSDAAIYRHTMNGIYVSYYTQTKAFYFEKAKYAKGFKVTHISTKEIANIPIPLPPLPLQQDFADKVEAIERQKTLIQQSIDEVQTLFDSRMDYWFG